MVKGPLSSEDEIMAVQKLLGKDLPEHCEITLEVRDFSGKMNDVGGLARGQDAVTPSSKVTIQKSGSQVFKKLEQLADLRLVYW